MPDLETVSNLAAEAGLGRASMIIRRVDAPGVRVGIAPEQALYPASMIKTPLVAAALAEVEAGRLELDRGIDVTEANVTWNDAPSPLQPGYRAELSEICNLAISRSDNVATNMLFDVVGRERATQIVQTRFALANTAFYRKLSGSDPLIVDPQWDGTHRNTHSPADAARLFELIALDQVPYADLLRAALAEQYWNDKLTTGLRDGDRFAHKTGDTSEVTHDGGILTTAKGNNTYIIVVYSGLPSTDVNNARFGAFMRNVRASL